MKALDIIKKIDDTKLYIEIIDADGASYGIFTKNDPLLVYNNNLKNKTIKNINAQYFKNKRLLVLKVK